MPATAEQRRIDAALQAASEEYDAALVLISATATGLWRKIACERAYADYCAKCNAALGISVDA